MAMESNSETMDLRLSVLLLYKRYRNNRITAEKEEEQGRNLSTLSDNNVDNNYWENKYFNMMYNVARITINCKKM